MSVRAPVGPVNVSTQEICIGRGLAAIRAGDKLDPDFLFYSLKALEPSISGNAGAVFASINKRQIEQLQIPLPPLDEQRSIVAKLDEIFASASGGLEATEQSIAELESLQASILTSELVAA